MSATLLNVGKKSSQRITSLIGGKSSASMCGLPQMVGGDVVIGRSVAVGTGAVGAGAGAGLRPGYVSDNATYFSSHTSSPRCVTIMVAPSAGSEIHEASRTS